MSDASSTMSADPCYACKSDADTRRYRTFYGRLLCLCLPCRRRLDEALGPLTLEMNYVR